MTRRRLRERLFLVVAVGVAAGCIRLGIWQLDRLDERRGRNQEVSERLSAPPLDARTIADDTGGIRFRRATLTGIPDYERELVLMSRSHSGSPGVNLILPVRIPGSDTAVLVNRGWVYSPDGMSVDRDRWREADSTFIGYVELMVPGRDSISRAGAVRRMQLAELQRKLPYPIQPFYLVVVGDSSERPAQDRVARLGSPSLGEGSHFSYAMQWFSFAAVALVGGAIAWRSGLRARPARTMQEPVARRESQP